MTAQPSSLLRSVSSYYLFDVISLVSTVVTTRLILRAVGPESFGTYTATAAIVGYLALLDLGLGQAVTAFVARAMPTQDTHAMREVTSTVLALATGLAFVAIGAGVALWLATPSFLPNGGGNVALILSVRTALKLVSSIGPAALFGVGNVAAYNIVRTLGVVSEAIAIGVATHIGGGIEGVALAMLVAPTVTFIAGALSGRALKVPVPSVASVVPRRIPELLTYSTVFTVNQLIVLVVFQTDSIVIANALPIGLVTSYMVTQKLVYSGMGLCFKLSDSLFPTFARLEASLEMEEVRKTYTFALRVTMTISTLVAVGIVANGRWLVELWTGTEGFAGTSVLVMLAAVILVHAPVHVASGYLAATGRLKQTLAMSIAEGLANFVFTLAFVRSLGLFGVAMGTLVGMVLTTSWYVPELARRALRMSLHETWVDGVLHGTGQALPFALGMLALEWYMPAQSTSNAIVRIVVFLSATALAAFMLRSLRTRRARSSA